MKATSKGLIAPRPLKQAVVFLILAVSGLAGAACGGSPSSRVANLGSTTTTTTPPPSVETAGTGRATTSKYEAALAYVDCMRAHSVSNFPDPANNGQINVKFAYGGKDGAAGSSGIDRMSPAYISADQTCRHLLPDGVPTPAQNEHDLAKELRFAECMRAHGVPKFPDPANTGEVHLLGVDQNSSEYQRARKACEALVPGSDSK